MKRRDFLKSSACLAAASALPLLTRCGGDDGGRRQASTGTLLLRSASLLDVRTGEIREEDRLLIREGKIADLFAGDGAEAHAESVLDLGGAYVTPGLNNARLLGLEDRIGTIEKGKTADLVVFEKNPLETAENAFTPLMVFQEGRLAFRS
ncbi:MAG: amidohydrolase family protein [bacterium]